MMSEFVEIRKNAFIFKFYWKENYETRDFVEKLFSTTGYSDIYDMKCECGRILDLGYVHIIHKLKMADLLPESYTSMCCFCNILACVGFTAPDELEDCYIDHFEEIVDGYDTYYMILVGRSKITQDLVKIEITISNVDLALKTGRISKKINLEGKWNFLQR